MKHTNTLSTETDWSFLQKILFRFSFIFFSLYIVPFPATYLWVFNISFSWLTDSWNRLVVFTGKHILHLAHDITSLPNGSGDTTWNYVQIFLIFGTALLGTLIWTIADRKRKNYQRLLYWFTAVVRYYLSFYLLMYGSIKIFKSQFPEPNLYRLTETYGQSSPMGLAWTFLGYSKGFNYFMGSAEAIAGLLLFFRRTKTIGALFSMTVAGNIVAMNFCYDVPVKLFSSMLFLMAVFIALPDIHRLFRFFILNQDARLKSNDPQIKTRKVRIFLLVVKLVFIAFSLYLCVNQAITSQFKYGDKAPKPKRYGSYQIDTYTKNGNVIAPLLTDTTRWKRIIFSENDRGAVEMMNDTLRSYIYDEDTSRHEITLLDRITKQTMYSFSYQELDKDHLEFRGKDESEGLYMKLVRKQPEDFPLMNRGFHWINEYPLNR